MPPLTKSESRRLITRSIAIGWTVGAVAGLCHVPVLESVAISVGLIAVGLTL